jgi:predicted dehydrogenase
VTRIRVGFIGAGRIADLHALGYRDSADAELYAVCDADGQVAADRAREWGAGRSLTDYREMLADPKVDAVEVLTPHRFHEEMAVAALEADKHVSLQKPMAVSLEQADAIVAAARRSDRVFRVFENFRYYPPYVRAKELLDEGAIGEPLSLRVKVIGGNPRHGWQVPAGAWAWRLSEEECGGGPMIFDHGYHIFSIAMYFLGAVERVFAWIERAEVGPGMTLDSPAAIVWRHTGGPRFGFWETVTSPELMVRSKYYPNDEWVELTGTRGLIWVNRCSGEMLPGPPLVVYRDGETQAVEDIESDWAAGFVQASQAFVRAMREGGQPELSAEEGREVLRFSLAAHRAAREGRPVALAEMG